jgi:hypothetical protein
MCCVRKWGCKTEGEATSSCFAFQLEFWRKFQCFWCFWWWKFMGRLPITPKSERASFIWVFGFKAYELGQSGIGPPPGNLYFFFFFLGVKKRWDGCCCRCQMKEVESEVLWAWALLGKLLFPIINYC